MEPAVTVDYTRYGVPSQLTTVLAYKGWAACYDHRTRSPLWVLERLNKKELLSGSCKREGTFREDSNVPEIWAAGLEAFRGSGYDRGHLAASADMCYSRDRMLETYSTTNIAAQSSSLNRNYWAAFEHMLRGIAKSKNVRNVYVVSGPLFVPSAFATEAWYHGPALHVAACMGRQLRGLKGAMNSVIPITGWVACFHFA